MHTVVTEWTRGVAFAAIVTAAAPSYSCGGAQHEQSAAVPARPRAPDVHGEPLALLPPSPLVWLRVEMRAVRLSQHWERVYPLLQRNAGESLATMERELGFDPLRAADTLALGLYAPPGARTGDGTHAWPVFYARGQIQRDAILAAARARARHDDPLVERTMDGVTYYATRERGYLFPANDVVIVFEASLTRRVLRELQGVEPDSPARETRFDSLWTQAEGRRGTIQFAGDIAALRAAGAPVDEVATAAGQGNAGASRIEQAVAHADIDAAVSIRFAALASDAGAAQRVVADIDAVRSALLRRWDVRLLGMTRLLMQGVTDVSEGRIVRIRVDAQPSEVVRLLGVARIAAQ
jgi:hypothetical protein